MDMPSQIKSGLDLYRDHHIRPGSFLCAVIANDLRDAASRADTNTWDSINEILRYMLRDGGFDPECYGSREAINRWVASS